MQKVFFLVIYLTVHGFHSLQSTENVLILEYMDGIRLNDSVSLEAFGVDKQKVVEEITRAYAHQIYVDGFFNGDPHPGTFIRTFMLFISFSALLCLLLFVPKNSLLFCVSQNHFFSQWELVLSDCLVFQLLKNNIFFPGQSLSCLFAGNFLVSKEAPHRPILLDFGLTKKLSSAMKQALAKMLLASAEVRAKSKCFMIELIFCYNFKSF